MLFQMLKLGSIFFILKKSKEKLILAQKKFLNETHTVFIKLIYMSILFCIAYITLLAFYFIFIDFKLRVSLPNELNYENLAWINVRPVKLIVDEYIKIFFDSFYSVIKFIISELLVIPILLFLIFILYKSKNNDKSNLEIENLKHIKKLKPKRRIDIFKRKIHTLFNKNTTINENTTKNLLKNEKADINSDTNSSFCENNYENKKFTQKNNNPHNTVSYKNRRRIDIARKNLKNLFKSYEFDRNSEINTRASNSNIINKKANSIKKDEFEQSLNEKSSNKKRRRIDVAKKNLRNLITNGILK